MTPIKIEDLEPFDRLPDKPEIHRSVTDAERPCDITLLNLNLMLVNQAGHLDQQNYLPLGLLYIASSLEQHGYNVELIDYQLFSHARLFDVDLFLDAVGEMAPVVGISCMTNLMPFAILCAEAIKHRHPGSKVVLGGTGPSPVAAQITQAFPFVDSVVTGEGEVPLRRMLEQGFEPTPPRQLVPDLDDLPLPAYSLIDFSKYDAAPSIISSRGCPFHCTFCTEPHNFGGRVRFRDPDSVVRELETVHAFSGQTLFLFQDDTLPLNPRRFDRLLRAFGDLSFPFLWKCFGRVDLMDEALMQRMVDAGCVQIRFGIESGSNKTLSRIKKGFTIEKAWDTVQKALRFFPSVHVSFIWGFPFEEPAELRETLKYTALMEEAGATVLLFEFSPLPGSEIYREWSDGLTFSPNDYSFFVVTGHERVQRAGYDTDPAHGRIYRLIQEHPQVFSGFYRYSNRTKLRSKRLMDQFKTTRRTKVRTEYDL